MSDKAYRVNRRSLLTFGADHGHEADRQDGLLDDFAASFTKKDKLLVSA